VIPDSVISIGSYAFEPEQAKGWSGAGI